MEKIIGEIFGTLHGLVSLCASQAAQIALLQGKNTEQAQKIGEHVYAELSLKAGQNVEQHLPAFQKELRALLNAL